MRLPLVLTLAVLASCTAAPEHSAPTAIAACERFVRERLRAPASAQFPAEGRDVNALGDGRYEITGAVDSQNGFGALIRGKYVCSVEWLTGEIYNLKDVSLATGGR